MIGLYMNLGYGVRLSKMCSSGKLYLPFLTQVYQIVRWKTTLIQERYHLWNSVVDFDFVNKSRKGKKVNKRTVVSQLACDDHKHILLPLLSLSSA